MSLVASYVGPQLVVTLSGGTVVAAKVIKDRTRAYTFANRTQAEKLAARLGSGWYVSNLRGRPFFVVYSGIHTVDFGSITTKAQAVAALKKLGYTKALVQMARGATSLSHPCGFMVTVAPAAFIALGPEPLNSRWGCISNLLGEDAYFAKCDALRVAGVLGDVAALNTFGFAVALAAAAVVDSSGGDS